MGFKYVVLLPLLFIIAININSCSNSTEPTDKPVLRISQPPTITGFYKTTDEYPDGTGEIVGNPPYKPNRINVFPNPFPEYPVPEGMAIYGLFVTFNHLPTKVTIIIVKGRSQEETNEHSSSILGVPITPTGIWKVKTLEKNDPSQFYRWNLRDENSIFVPTGYYRAYFYGDGIPANNWVDIYIDMTPFLNYKFSRF